MRGHPRIEIKFVLQEIWSKIEYITKTANYKVCPKAWHFDQHGTSGSFLVQTRWDLVSCQGILGVSRLPQLPQRPYEAVPRLEMLACQWGTFSHLYNVSVHLLRSSFARLGEGLARTARTRRGQSSGNWRRLPRSTSPTWWSGSRWRFSSTRPANLTPKSAPQPASQADYLLHGQNRSQWGTRPRVPGTEFWQRSATCNGVSSQALRRQYTFVGYVRSGTVS